jgi:methionine biosynthesis protein MetW
MNRDLPYPANPAHRIIFDLIPQKATVLDLGCGSGELLQALITLKAVRGQGVEISAEKVTECVRLGIPVFHGNIDEGLKEYPDQSYDYAVLNQTLQAVHNTELVLSEMLRVGRSVIVGIPNFAHWRIRATLLFSGRLPVTSVYKFQWYDTPNIRLTTLIDFESLCRKLKARIVSRVCLKSTGNRLFLGRLAPNFFSENAIYVLSRN